MSLWIIVAAIGVLALYVFVLPIGWAQITARIAGEDALEVLMESLEDTFDHFGGRVAHFLALTGIAGLAWLAWSYYHR